MREAEGNAAETVALSAEVPCVHLHAFICSGGWSHKSYSYSANRLLNPKPVVASLPCEAA